jgi:hypothetical protein
MSSSTSRVFISALSCGEYAAFLKSLFTRSYAASLGSPTAKSAVRKTFGLANNWGYKDRYGIDEQSGRGVEEFR